LISTNVKKIHKFIFDLQRSMPWTKTRAMIKTEPLGDGTNQVSLYIKKLDEIN